MCRRDTSSVARYLRCCVGLVGRLGYLVVGRLLVTHRLLQRWWTMYSLAAWTLDRMLDRMRFIYRQRWIDDRSHTDATAAQEHVCLQLDATDVHGHPRQPSCRRVVYEWTIVHMPTSCSRACVQVHCLHACVRLNPAHGT